MLVNCLFEFCAASTHNGFRILWRFVPPVIPSCIWDNMQTSVQTSYRSPIPLTYRLFSAFQPSHTRGSIRLFGTTNGSRNERPKPFYPDTINFSSSVTEKMRLRSNFRFASSIIISLCYGLEKGELPQIALNWAVMSLRAQRLHGARGLQIFNATSIYIR